MMSVERFHALSDDQLDAVDAACLCLEESWKQGQRVSIEQMIEHSDRAVRAVLLRELLATEIELRISSGEQPRAVDYRSRFPDHLALIDHAFDFASNPDVPAGPIKQLDEMAVTVALAGSATGRLSATPESQRAEEATSFAPQSFGRYTLLCLLGQGGMGSVCLAHDRELDRHVAIKFPKFDDRPDVAAAAIERFRREARAMATLHHPNICPIFDVGQHEGRHYLTMAWIDGRSLSEAVGSLSQTEIVGLVITISRALHAAHQAGIVHRDLKPSNVMLDQRGEPIVMDFGLASRASVTESGLTHSGLIIGSPAYMAPEQVDAAHDKVGPRTDVYALGVILYQLLTGRRPFDGAGLSVLGKIAAGIRPESPSQIADVSPALEAICLKAMAHQIEDRFESAGDLAESLDGWLKTADAKRVQAHTSRRKTALMAGGIAVLALGSLFMAIANRPDSTEKLPGFQKTVELPVSGPVTASSNDRLEPIPASESVPDAAAPAPLKVPFDEQQARAGQQEWADYLGLPVEYTNSIGMKFRLIPPGEFLMGSKPEAIEAALSASDSRWREHIESEGPQHKVILTKPIYVGLTEVTQTQYEHVMGNNPSHFSATGEGKDLVANLETGSHPVEMVTWYDAAEFCAKLSQQEKLDPFYSRSGESVTLLEGAGYRLPTEAQWEYACRAGTTTRFWSGDQDQGLISGGWHSGNAGNRAHAAGESKPNPFGLSDMHGNVWEWVQDGWDPAFYSQFQKSAAVDPFRPFPTGQYARPVRGGDWHSAPFECRSAQRLQAWPNWQRPNTGFRVVLVADAVKELLGMTSENHPPPSVAPFDEKQARIHQQEWADHLGVPVEHTNSIGMTFRLIPPGEFLMGSTPEEIEAALKVVRYEGWRANIEGAGPQHQVVLTKPLYVGVTEVTQSQYEQVMGLHPSFFSATGRGKDAVANLDTSNHPVESVSWFDAVDFCIKLSQQEARTPFYSRSNETVTSMDGTGYRLPTAAEWEHACRAGTTTRFWSSEQDRDLFQVGWFVDNSGGRTHPVGELEANPFGLLDVHGNVWEWVEDSWDPTFYSQFQETAAIDPSAFASSSSPDDLRRVFRGGNWDSYASECRSSFHLNLRPSSRPNYTGFRVVLTVEAVKDATRRRPE